MPRGVGVLNGSLVLAGWALYCKAALMSAPRAAGFGKAIVRQEAISIMRMSAWKALASVAWLVPLAVVAGLAPHASTAGAAAGAGSEKASAEIRGVLMEQQAAWNRGDLDGFLMGYQRSDATAFAGTQGIVRGWDGLRERYRKGYPDRRAMGTLTFSELEITPLCGEAALALGHWHLEREAGPVGGVFSLVLRRLPEGWRIVADHTSVVKDAAPSGKP